MPLFLIERDQPRGVRLSGAGANPGGFAPERLSKLARHKLSAACGECLYAGLIGFCAFHITGQFRRLCGAVQASVPAG